MTVFALLGALSACASQQPDQAGTPVGLGRPASEPSHAAARSVGGAQPNWPAAPAGGRALPPSQVDASSLPEGYPRLVWTEGDGRTVGAYGQEGGCTVVHSELLAQTPKLVRIEFVEVTKSAGPCTMDLRFRPLRVVLDTPLGRRTVALERRLIGP